MPESLEQLRHVTERLLEQSAAGEPEELLALIAEREQLIRELPAVDWAQQAEFVHWLTAADQQIAAQMSQRKQQLSRQLEQIQLGKRQRQGYEQELNWDAIYVDKRK